MSRPATRLAGVLTLGLLGASGWLDEPARADTHPRHKARSHAPHDPQPAAQAAQGPAENLVVHGQKRFLPAPMPNQEIHDPAGADSTRQRFGGAFRDSAPVQPLNPALGGEQSPVAVGDPRVPSGF